MSDTLKSLHLLGNHESKRLALYVNDINGNNEKLDQKRNDIQIQRVVHVNLCYALILEYVKHHISINNILKVLRYSYEFDKYISRMRKTLLKHMF